MTISSWLSQLKFRKVRPGFRLLALPLFGLAYFFAAKLGALFVVQPENIAAIWLAGGMALSVVLLAPSTWRRALFGTILLASAAADYSSGFDFGSAFGFAVANMLETMLAAYLILWFSGETVTFLRIRHVTALFVGTVIACAAAALVGAMTISLGAGAPFWNSWLVWWIADTLGILVITPFFVSWFTLRRELEWRTRRMGRAFVALLGWIFVGILVFGLGSETSLPDPRPYMLFPPLLWIAFQQRMRGVTLALAVLAGMVLVMTVLHIGAMPLGGMTHTIQLLLVQTYLAVLSVTGLFVAAVLEERTRAQIQLQNSELLYQSLAKTIPYSLYRKDASGKYLFGNARFLQEMQCSMPELLARTDIELPSPDFVANDGRSDRRVLLAGETVNVIQAKTMPNNESLFLQVIKSPIYDANGVVSGIQVMYWDVTREQELEQEHKAQAELIELVHVAVIVRDLASRVTFWNRGAEKLYGWTRAQAEGKNLHELLCTRASGSLAQIDQLILERGAWEGEFEHTCIDGSVIIVSSRQALQRNRDGLPMAFLEVNADITQDKRAEARLKYLSLHDGLTDLYNRAFFEAEMQRLNGAGDFPISILIVDLDNLKMTNDTQGHLAGDELLRRTAEILRTVFRDSAILARIGGDEFAAILPRVDKESAAAVKQRLRDEIDAKNASGGPRLEFSIGVATSVGRSLPETFKLADARMYLEKHGHKNDRARMDMESSV